MVQTRKNLEEGIVAERPPTIRGLSVSIGVTLILVVLATWGVLTGEAAFVRQPATALVLGCPSPLEVELADLINQERLAAGMPLLELDIRLIEAAQLHSLDMATNNFFSHTGSGGSSVSERVSLAGYTWSSVGENIAAGYQTPASVVAGWMDSPGHKANILGSGFEHLGVGYAYDAESDYGRYWTADFGSSPYAAQPPAPGCADPATPTVSPPLPTPTAEPFFLDVPVDHPYYAEIEILFEAGYIAGCSAEPLMYCPEQTMNRAESAVFVERGIHSATFAPADPVNQIFADVPLDSWAARWANSLWEDQYTAGCGTNPLLYCPWQGHTRAEGCVFYLRMLKGYDFTPPPPSSRVFADVPLDAWYAGWVQEAYAAGLLGPCSSEPELRYCPEDPLTRAAAAYMLVQAKGLR